MNKPQSLNAAAKAQPKGIKYAKPKVATLAVSGQGRCSNGNNPGGCQSGSSPDRGSCYDGSDGGY